MSKKKDREITRMKFGGRCAYCGDKLQKVFHVDELLPVRRNFKRSEDGLRWIHDGTCIHPERLHIDNQMPSCPSCNINKHSDSLEMFRARISGFIVSLNRDSVQYKVAKRYGLIKEVKKPVIFYFEKL